MFSAIDFIVCFFPPAVKNIGTFSTYTQVDNAEKKPQQKKSIAACQDDCGMLNHNQKTCSLWDMPESILVCILRGLHIRDLMSFRLVRFYLFTM